MASTQTESTKKNTKSAKASRRNAIGDFLVEHIDGALMRSFVKDKKIDLDVDVPDEQVAVALVMWFKDNTEKTDLVRCDVCNAVSSAKLDECPFCGDKGEVEEGDEEEEEEATTASDRSDEEKETAAEQDEEEDEDDEEEVDDEDETDEDEDVSTNDTPDEKPIAAAPESEPAPAAAAAETTNKKNTKKTKEDATMTTTSAVNGTGSKKSTALARASKSEVVTAKDLDKAIHEVEKLKKEYGESTLDAAETYWQMGRKLLEINEGQLWKMRVDEKGKATYKSWDQFVTRELSMSPQQSYAAIDIGREYDSPKVLREIGQTKAANILKAAPVDRPALVEAAKNGATVREINAKVKKSRAKHGSPKKDKQQAKAGKKAAAKTNAAAATRSERVSITSFEGSKTVKLYAKPDTMKGVDFSKLKRAKTLADKPFGRVEMANGLVQTITLVKNADGEMFLKIDTRREA